MASLSLRNLSFRNGTSTRSFSSFRHPPLPALSEKNVTRSHWKIWKEDYMHHVLKLIGCAVFYFVCVWYYYNESLGWSIVDCIYFITVSITTVGYGDMTPETNGQRIFTIFMLFVGMIAVFSTINEFATYIITTAERKAMARLDDEVHGRAKYAYRVVLSLSSILICLAVGTIFFIYNEEWDFVTSLYFAVVTTVSVGYGDRVLTHESSRMFLIVYIVLSVIIVAGAIGNFGSIKLEMVFDERRIEMLTRDLDMEALLKMDLSGNGVDELQFLTEMLIQMHGLDRAKDIDPWRKRFRELDADGSGKLDKEDLELFARQQHIDSQNLLQELSRRNLMSFYFPNKSEECESDADADEEEVRESEDCAVEEEEEASSGGGGKREGGGGTSAGADGHGHGQHGSEGSSAAAGGGRRSIALRPAEVTIHEIDL